MIGKGVSARTRHLAIIGSRSATANEREREILAHYEIAVTQTSTKSLQFTNLKAFGT